MLSGREEYFRKCFDLIGAEGCKEITICQYMCVIGSYLDPVRLHKLNTTVMTPQMIASLRNFSLSISGDDSYFNLPMKDELVRRVLRRIDTRFTGGKYDEFL